MADSFKNDPLVERLRCSDLSRVVARLAARIRQGRPLRGKLLLKSPTDDERRAIVGLCGGRGGKTNSISLSLDALRQLATRDGRFESLEQLIEAAYGRPLGMETIERLAAKAAWEHLWPEACQSLQNAPAMAAWLGRPATRSWIRRLAEGNIEAARRLLQGVAKCMGRLPSEPPIPLAQFAAQTLGDSHALDRDAPLGRLVLRALAAKHETPPPTKASEVRPLWAREGIVLDELSTTVLVLNLPSRRGGDALSDVLARLQEAGEPCRLTFRQLRGERPCEFFQDHEREIFVCENPAVVAAAAQRWGAACRPLVCVEGQPNLAAERLLSLLAEQGFSLRYHGDFDWGGLRIASRIWERFRFRPWRYTAQDYLAAPPGRPLAGPPVAAPWDECLAPAMRSVGAAIHEEAVLGQLLADLGSSADFTN